MLLFLCHGRIHGGGWRGAHLEREKASRMCLGYDQSQVPNCTSIWEGPSVHSIGTPQWLTPTTGQALSLGALGCSGASGPGCEVMQRWPSVSSSIWGRFPSDTEVTQGALCSAALVRSFLPVPTYEHFTARVSKAREGPGNLVVFVFLGPRWHSALHVVGT